jgi:alpha-glucosidase
MPALRSPDGRLSLEFTLDASRPTYQVAWRDEPVVSASRLGLELASGPLTEGFSLVRQRTRRVRKTWKPVYGERSTVLDHYDELTLELRSGTRGLTLTFRAYDNGIAFCYSLSADTVQVEKTEFRFPADHIVWAVYTAQGPYQKTKLSQLKPGCERPLVLQAGENRYIALAEARLVDYARTKFAPLEGVSNALVSEMAGPATYTGPFTTPWRVIQVGESPGKLLEGNDLLLNLNAPGAIRDTGWIKPGKVIREASLTTVGAKACVDFAVKRKLQYIEFDAGWYGYEYDDASDATGVHLDPRRSKGPLDLPEVIRYARERGIGVWLYVNQRALTRQLDVILPLYQKWGIVGVKYGFVHVGPQAATLWLHEAVRKAAQHRLMVDIHDEYRPTGYSRTYPNLMTQEGIRGDEERQPNDLTLATVFTRMLAGAADNTFCYYDKRVTEQSSHAYQLAKSVCIYSPVQFLYWYDRPDRSKDEPELEFWDALPTTWDETRVLHGQIGEYAVIARRKGTEWFIGGMTNGTPRELNLPLNFLKTAGTYTAHIYSDDPTVPTATKVRIDRKSVSARTVWKMILSARGGQALRIVPEG